MIRRGRSASEYIPRPKDKDHHLPEIPSMNIKSSADRAASASGKSSTESSPQKSPPTTSQQQSPTVVPQSPPSDQSVAVVSSEGQTSGAGEALEASTDFARNVRGTSTPIDMSPDMTTNRSQTFNSGSPVLNTSETNDRKTDTVDTSETNDKKTNSADTVDTQQIELSIVNDDHESDGQSRSHSDGGTKTDNSVPPKAQSEN